VVDRRAARDGLRKLWKTKMPKPRSPSFAQLCAIARDEIAAERSIDDGEWCERIKCTLVRRGLAYPPPHVITDAMRRVERALAKAWGARPASLPTPPVEPPPEPRPLSHVEACRAIAQLAVKPRAMPHATPDDERRAAWERQQTQRLQLVVEAAEQSRARLAAAQQGVSDEATASDSRIGARIGDARDQCAGAADRDG
jgi:hypothetical protein